MDRFRYEEAKSAQQRAEVFGLRYRVFVEEFGYRVPDASPEHGLEEPADRSAGLFIAYDGERPVGTLTVDWWAQVPLAPELVGHLHLEGFAQTFGRASVAVIRKALVVREYRGTPLFSSFVAAIFPAILRPPLRFLFVACSPYLVGYYQQFGFRHYAPHFSYDQTGIIAVPLCGVIGDHAHLEHVGSPLLGPLRACDHPVDHRTEEYFCAQWTFHPINPLRALESLAPPAGSDALDISKGPLFEGVPTSTVQRFFASCELVTLERDQPVIAEGMPFEAIYLLADGYLEVSRQGLAIATLGPGDLVGEVSSLLETLHQVDVTALTRTTLYRISPQLLREQLQQQPEIAALVYRNLARILARRLRSTNMWITKAPPL